MKTILLHLSLQVFCRWTHYATKLNAIRLGFLGYSMLKFNLDPFLNAMELWKILIFLVSDKRDLKGRVLGKIPKTLEAPEQEAGKMQE